ncbi:Heterokaryon incompatibility protein 6, OR allele [Pseudocercospora fuligena]|uniref:Heterokaryon incompatibility protein 6, OR allele n=1 Tax=Pseudocercospora fuligena TaxID=685502 RepID=A0A8H6VKN0_9PEZI|nr:Heterokaryon incompatibility protein 6, OR allele [Pseudocercospora fuligena]
MAERQVDDPGYAYERLKDASQIRVLDLQPGSWKDDIHARLRTVARNEAKYEALSYVWGPRTQGRTLYLDKKHKVSITDNLFLALRRLRKKWTARTLWIDAVCINQLDNVEKSEQVASMADTYRDAKIVNVWLGESIPARSIHLKYAFAPEPSTVSTSRHLRQVVNNLASHVTWFCQNLVHHNQVAASENDIEPWHTRAWTLQEAALARKVRFCLGRARLVTYSDDSVAKGFLSFEEHERCALRLNISTGDLISIRGRVQDRSPRERIGLIQIISVLRGTSATDPRDLVYGILGILREDMQQLIVSDYTLTFAEVCATATAAALRTSTIEALAYVKFKDDESASWVSWAVDFACKHDGGKFSLMFCLQRSVIIASFGSTTLGILGRTFGIAAESKSSESRPSECYLRKGEQECRGPLNVVGDFLKYAKEACGCALLVKLSNGVEVLAPGVVQPGDQLVRLCYTTAFRDVAPEVFIWLRPNGNTFLFRGLGLVLGSTVYTGNYHGWNPEFTDDRTEAVKQAGFETFLVR